MCRTVEALREALNTLPKTLDDTYTRILLSVDDNYSDDALKILQWLCFSGRPLRLEEMVEVLAIEAGQTLRFNADKRFQDTREMLAICPGLVSIETKPLKYRKYYRRHQADASAHGYVNIVKLLLDNGADVNAKNGSYGAPLHAAASRGCDEVVKLLVERGGDVDPDELPEELLRASGMVKLNKRFPAYPRSIGAIQTTIVKLLFEQRAAAWLREQPSSSRPRRRSSGRCQ